MSERVAASASRTALAFGLAAAVTLGCGSAKAPKRDTRDREMSAGAAALAGEGDGMVGRAGAGPDYSKLEFRGNGFDSDSFCLAVAAAARLLGREASYEDVLALTTNAFAPGFDTGNDCKELWITNAWVSHLGPVDAAWRHLGLRVEPVLHPEHPGDPNAPEYRRAMAKLVGAAMADGKVVVTCGGWEHEREWVEPWWAGIVTGVREDGTVLGAHLNGRKDNALRDLNSGALLAVSLAQRSLSDAEANVEAMRNAVGRIRAEGEPGSFGRHRFAAFGVDAMDDWIAQMRGVPHFCPPCQENHSRGWRSAEVVAHAAVHRSGIAAAWLRGNAASFPEAARPNVAAAASHYDRIVELLRPALAREGDESYRSFIGDIERQKAHAEKVLVRVKAELAAAADEMERALASALGARFTDKEKQRLRQWGNIFGFKKILEVAESDPVFYELLGQELALGAMSDAANRLRGAMGRIEPAELKYAAQLDAVFEALASGDAPEDILLRGGFSWDSPLWDARKARIAELAAELGRWLDRGTGALAPTLGEPDEDKRRLVTLTLQKMREGSADEARLEEVRRDGRLGPFAHRIEMLDAAVWSHDRNFDLLIRGIGKLRPVGEWHAKTGPLAWGDADPALKPKVEGMLSKLDAWLAGGEDPELGARDAYPEKLWLARCLATYLRYHLRSSWDWTEKGAKVKREGGRVVIEGLEEAKWGGFTDRQNTVIAAMEEALRAMGEEVTFEFLSGVSGAAFRLLVAQPEWCPSAPYATVGFDCSAPAAAAFGYTLERHSPTAENKEGSKEWDEEGVRRRTAAIVESIDAGRPALLDGIDCSVIVGYENGGETLLLRRSGAREDGYGPLDEWTWESALVFRRRDRAPGRRLSVVRSLEIAVELARTEGFKGCASGLNAYRRWAERLEDEAKFEDLGERDLKNRCFVNGWMFMSLAGDRKMAAGYMRKVAAEFDGEAAARLSAAAGLYAKITDLLFSKRDGFPDPYYLMPADLDGGRGWTEKLRRAQAAILRDALALEREAVGEIEKALVAAEGKREMATGVKREGSRVWIEGVPDGRFGEGWDMIARATRTLLAARGVDADIEEVMALSGDAFNLCHASNWQGVAYLCIPTDPVANVARAYGFESGKAHAGNTGPLLGRGRDEKLAMTRAALERARAEIEAGRPVLAAGAEEHCGRVTVVVGHDSDGPALRHVGDGEPGRWTPIRGVTPGAPDDEFGLMDGRWRGTVTEGFVGGWQANPLYFIGKRTGPPSARERTLDALARAVDLFDAPKHHRGNWGGVDCFFGREAYAEWAKALDALDYPADLEKPQPEGADDWYEMANMHIQTDQVVRGRTAAARFCREAGTTLGGVAGECLKAAASRYEEEVGIARRELAPFAAEAGGGAAARVAWLPDDAKREAGARAVRAMLEKERAAVGRIEKALAWADEAPGQVRPAELVELRLDRTEGQETRDGVWRAHVPSAVVQALRRAGVDTDYSEVVAASGWAFSFAYRYDNWHVAALPVDHFTALPGMMGLELTTIRCGDAEAWEFVTRHIDSGSPVICTHGDGGLVYGYREREGERQLWFDGCPAWGWIKASDPHPEFDTHSVLARKREAKPEAERVRAALANALREAEPHEDGGTQRGLAGLEAYLADVEDPANDFEETGEWFCWATFERLTARRCAASWLRRAAEVLGDDARGPLLAAAGRYEEAFAAYRQYDKAVHDGEYADLHDRVRTPERIAAIAPFLKRGIEAERAGVEELRKALAPSRRGGRRFGGAGAAARVGREGDRVVLEGLTHQANWVSYMGALVSCAKFLDSEVPEAWLWGACGYAFSLTVHEQLCPSGPYMPVGKFDRLLPNTGLELEKLSAESGSEGAAEEVAQLFDLAREAVEAGLPLMGWSLEHIDWYPVCGYDGEGNYLFLRHDGRPGAYPHPKLGEKAPGGLALLLIVRPGRAPDDAAVVRDALRFALKMGRGEFSHGEYTSGLGGYDVWIKALDGPQGAPSDGTCFGHAFNAACWHECRRQAVTFLEEAKRRLNSNALSPRFDEAIARYRTVAEQFSALTELYPCRPGEDEAMRERFEDAGLRRRAVAALAAARAAEAEGLDVLAGIEKALAAPGDGK